PPANPLPPHGRSAPYPAPPPRSFLRLHASGTGARDVLLATLAVEPLEVLRSAHQGHLLLDPLHVLTCCLLIYRHADSLPLRRTPWPPVVQGGHGRGVPRPPLRGATMATTVATPGRYDDHSRHNERRAGTIPDPPRPLEFSPQDCA